MNILAVAGIILGFVGLLVSVLFWVPQVINRPRLKELLGKKYPVIYFIYIANGPLLVILGLMLYLVFSGHLGLYP